MNLSQFGHHLLALSRSVKYEIVRKQGSFQRAVENSLIGARSIKRIVLKPGLRFFLCGKRAAVRKVCQLLIRIP